MSLITNIDALITALPGGGYSAAGLCAVAGAAIIGPLWVRSNPAPHPADWRPHLTPPRTGKVIIMDPSSSPSPMDIPLDAIPKDDSGRTPYDVIGQDVLRVAVEQFYSKLLGDPALRDFFDGVDLPLLKRHQALFIGQLWGGPVHFPLEALAGVHHRLEISADKYWRVAGHLMATLTFLGVPDWICLFTLARLYQARDLVISPKQKPKLSAFETRPGAHRDRP